MGSSETTEETMRDSLAPDKMNLAEFGNMVPHLHWHVIARWKDDGWYPECPWGTKQREVNAEIIKMQKESRSDAPETRNSARSNI